MESNTRLLKLWHGTDHWEGGIVIPFWGYRIRFGGKKVTTYREVTATMTTIDIPLTPIEVTNSK